MDYIAIVNTIRANSSQQYQSRVPELTRNNLEAVGNAITTYEPDTNEFLSALVNRIAFTEVSNRRYRNPLSVLKKGGKPFGTDIEEIYTNPVKSVNFNGSATDDMLKITPPDTKTIFHRDNRQSKYPVSVTEAELQKAFTSFDELGYFITSVINAMYSGDEMDEYLLMRNLVSSAIANNKVKSYSIAYDGEEATSRNLVKLLKTLSSDFTFPKSDFNGYNVLNAEGIAAGTTTECITWTPKENQLLLIRSDVDAATDVEVLAKAFNMDKTDFLQRKIVVDSFGDTKTLAFLCDEAIWKVRDTIYKVASFNNGSNLTTNWWLHHWQTLSMSLFGNGVAIQQES